MFAKTSCPCFFVLKTHLWYENSYCMVNIFLKAHSILIEINLEIFYLWFSIERYRFAHLSNRWSWKSWEALCCRNIIIWLGLLCWTQDLAWNRYILKDGLCSLEASQFFFNSSGKNLIFEWYFILKVKDWNLLNGLVCQRSANVHIKAGFLPYSNIKLQIHEFNFGLLKAWLTLKIEMVKYLMWIVYKELL